MTFVVLQQESPTTAVLDFWEVFPWLAANNAVAAPTDAATVG